MTTIQLPATIAFQLQQRATMQHRSVEELALAILSEALIEMMPQSAEDVVTTIKATAPNPQNTRPAQGSLADALRHPSPSQYFKLEQWNAEWAGVEAEMHALTQADDLAEGRA